MSQILGHFLDAPSSKRYLGLVSPLTFGEEKKQEAILSRIQNYADGRNSADTNTSSRMSPYLAAGVISARMVLNKARSKCKNGKLESGRDTGVGMWVQEVAWRDFYNHVRERRNLERASVVLLMIGLCAGAGGLSTRIHGSSLYRKASRRPSEFPQSPFNLTLLRLFYSGKPAKPT